MPQIIIISVLLVINTCLWIPNAGEHHIITYNIIYITWLENVDEDMAEEKCARKHAFFLYVKCPYKVRLSATFGLRFIILSYRTHTYEHLEEKIMSLVPLFNHI